MTYKQKLHDFFIKVVNKQFEIVGLNLTYEDIKDNQIPESNILTVTEMWYSKYPINDAQQEQFHKWFFEEADKSKLFSDKKSIEKNFAYFVLCYGLISEKSFNKKNNEI